MWILMLGCKRLKTEINITDKIYILSYIIETSLNSDLQTKKSGLLKPSSGGFC